MSRALLALLLLAGGEASLLSSPAMTMLFKAAVAADGAPGTDAGSRWDPNGTPTTQEETDAGSRWDPDG